MELSHYTLFNLGYLIVFALLGIFSLTLHTPRDDEHSNFKRARQILGVAFLFVAGYCVVRLILPYKSGDYTTFWLLVLASLIFSWLNYKAFLVLISSNKKLRQGFIVDGMIPALMLVVVGILGLFVPSIRPIAEAVFGVIFIAKAIRMFYICDKEWRKVNKKLKETYDSSPDIRWMRILLWLTFLFSLTTLWSFYDTKVAIAQSFVGPVVYVYMLLKIVNYLPKKIDEMRRQEAAELLIAAESNERAKDLAEKIEPLVTQWVAAKRFTEVNLSIKDVAQQMGTNHSYLSQYLNNYLNTSFQVWLNTLRIEESKIILEKENIPIEDVGIKVGIPQSYNFSRWFKQVTDTTPFKYRKQTNRDKGL